MSDLTPDAIRRDLPTAIVGHAIECYEQVGTAVGKGPRAIQVGFVKRGVGRQIHRSERVEGVYALEPFGQHAGEIARAGARIHGHTGTHRRSGQRPQRHGVDGVAGLAVGLFAKRLHGWVFIRPTINSSDE